MLKIPGSQGEGSAELNQLRSVEDLPDFEDDVDRAPEISHLVFEETPLKWEDPPQDLDHTFHIQPDFRQTLAILANIYSGLATDAIYLFLLLIGNAQIHLEGKSVSHPTYHPTYWR